MRWIATALLLALLGFTVPQASAQAFNPVSADDQERFDDLYEHRIKETLRTRDTDDNAALATEMVRYAASIPDEPGLQCLIYIEAIPLSASGMDLELMVSTANRLEWVWSEHENTDTDTLVTLSEKAFNAASREQRPKVAEPYLKLMLQAAAEAEQDGQINDALTICRRANTIARQIGSDRRQDIETTLSRLSSINALLSRIDGLAQSVRKNPQNRPAVLELVDLLVVKRDDPLAAAEFAGLTGDPDLTLALSACAQGVDKASGPSALRVGDWYLALAEQENDKYAEPLLRRCRAWYAQFQAVYTREDALAKRVGDMDLIAKGRLDRIEEARQIKTRGQWIDLIQEKYDPELDPVSRRKLRLKNGEIGIDKSSFMIPVTPEGAYELRVKLTVHRGRENRPAMVLYMPVGPESITFRYAWSGKRAGWIDGKDRDENEDEDDDKENRDRSGEEITLLFQAGPVGDDEFGVVMQMNNEQVIQWRGDREDFQALEPNEDYTPDEAFGRILKFTCPARVTFHSIEMRER